MIILSFLRIQVNTNYTIDRRFLSIYRADIPRMGEKGGENGVK